MDHTKASMEEPLHEVHLQETPQEQHQCESTHVDSVDDNLADEKGKQNDNPPSQEPEPVMVETVLSHEDEENDAFNDDAARSRPRDATERTVAMVIHCALYFFAALAMCTMILICILLTKFGGALMAVIVAALVMMGISLSVFLDKVMREDANWKPVRSRIQQLREMATAAIFEEVRNFKRDWNEHLLLTDGTVRNDDNEVFTQAGGSDADVFTVPATNEPSKRGLFGRRKGAAGAGAGTTGKSVMFQFVKPFLRIRKIGRRKKSNTKSDEVDGQNSTADTYVPPVV